MQERQLTNLFIQIGLERGGEIESIVEELAEMPLPSFVSPQAFRESLIDAAEDQLKLQLDERINTLRQRIGQEGQLQGRVNRSGQPVPASVEDDDRGGSGSSEPEQPESGEPDTVVVDDDLPTDATTIWQSRDE